MAFAGTLGAKGYQPERIETRATCTVSSQKGGGFRITAMQLDVRGRVPGIDETTFQQIAQEAHQGCPVSNLLRDGAKMKVEASLA
jgi:osmotically inducible protein OsmC